ncbi:MAG: pantetheine-phosphate adenylyltransferase [Chloroflexia bacterium]|nr:pantetheine-phosphate adenylyltransferase [Chloroflexia bacterium]
MITAVYPGSFDPVTNGHLDITSRAARVFDQVIVAVYERPNKRLLFSAEQRVRMIGQAIQDWPNVSVDRYESLTVEYARQVGAQVLIRGLRALTDFELELQMAHINQRLDPGIEVICLMASQSYSFLSSSIVKEIAALGANVSSLVPAHVARALGEHFAD